MACQPHRLRARALYLEGFDIVRHIRVPSIAIVLVSLLFTAFRPPLSLAFPREPDAITLAAPHTMSHTTIADAPDSNITLQTVDPHNPQLWYRVSSSAAGQIVEQSSDGGQQWVAVLTPGQPAPLTANVSRTAANAACTPARYTKVQAFTPASAAVYGLYVGTAGTPGTYLARGCDSTVGGIFAERSGASGGIIALGNDGLPYAEDPVGRTIRSYDVDTIVTTIIQNQTVLYVHASQGTGPGSPPTGLYSTMDNGQHWHEIDTGLQASAIITNAAGVAVPTYDAGSLSVAASNPRQLTFANDTGTYTSTDGGEHWRLVQMGTVPGIAPQNLPSAPAPGDTPAPLTVSAPQQASTAQAGVYQQVRPNMAALPGGWAWSQITPQGTTPPARQDDATAWDPVDHMMVVFGGTDTNQAQAMNDTWTFSPDTTTWSARATGPAGRFGASATWDPVDNVVLVYGGQTSISAGATFLGDLWAYAPSTGTWTQLWSSGATGGPTARSHAVVTWDSTNNRLLIFGGRLSQTR